MFPCILKGKEDCFGPIKYDNCCLFFTTTLVSYESLLIAFSLSGSMPLKFAITVPFDAPVCMTIGSLQNPDGVSFTSEKRTKNTEKLI